MLFQKGTRVFSGAVFCLVLAAAPVRALESLGSEFAKGGPAVAVCEELRTEMLFYHELFLQGGNSRQMEVWKSQYKKYVWQYGRRNCRMLAKKMAGREKSQSAPALASSD